MKKIPIFAEDAAGLGRWPTAGQCGRGPVSDDLCGAGSAPHPRWADGFVLQLQLRNGLVLETRRKMEVSYGWLMKHGGFGTFYTEKWWFNNETWKYSNEQWRFNYQKWWLEDKNWRLNPGKAFSRLKNPLVIQLASDNCQSEDIGISTGHLQWESTYNSLAIAAR